MKQKKNHTLRYTVLAVGAVLILALGWLIARTDKMDHVHTPIDYLLPEGTQIIQESDSHEFRDGTTFVAAHIPSEASEAFARKLQERSFTETPITEDVLWELTGVQEAEAALDVVNGLWYFRDDTPEQFQGERCYNYTFMIYDLNTCICYYIEYDS